MNARKRWTVKSTYALVAMSVLYAVIGFTTADKNMAQVLALTATLGIFSWLLSEALETYLEHRTQGNWRRFPTILLGLFLLLVEIHLVHFGAGWLFNELPTAILYLVSAGFSVMTVFAKATFGYTYPPDEPTKVEDSVLADRLEAVGGTTIIDDLDVLVA